MVSMHPPEPGSKGHAPVGTPAPAAVPPAVRTFVEALRGACDRVRAHLPEDALAALHVAAAALHYADWAHAVAARPPQVAVLGPTQSGKSTVVNMLVGRAAAGVSPLAGFTVHAHGICTGPSAADARWSQRLFPGWQRVAAQQLRRDVLETFALTDADPRHDGADAAGDLRGCVVWDTPDFDSLAARSYARAVYEVAALADVHVLVLSPEKYADDAVWRVMAILAPLGRGLCVCLNKMAPDAEAAILRALRGRFAERFPGRRPPPLATVPYVPQLAPDASPGLACRPSLASAIRGLLDTGAGATRAAGIRELIRTYWPDWTRPVRAEHEAVDAWRAMIAAECDVFLRSYERDYLNHPQRFDGFRRAAIELLELLELPRIGGAVAQARAWVTWPARRLARAAHTWWTDRRRPADPLHALGAEVGILIDALHKLLTRLESQALRRRDGAGAEVAVWRTLSEKLQSGRSGLEAAFRKAIQRHHEQTTLETRAAARKLYEVLRTKPGRLAALRTARAAIDVGYVLLAIKSAGLTPMDAVWAPATFALTSLLMEGAVGLEMTREMSELKARQRRRLKTELLDGLLSQRLVQLAHELAGTEVIGVGPAVLQGAERALAEWETDRA